MGVLERSVAAYQRSLDLTQFRYGGGVAARVDVLQAQTQLKAAQAQLAEAVAQRQILEHAIAVLLGVPPSALALERNTPLPQAPLVPQLLPTTLLERPPDIAAKTGRRSLRANWRGPRRLLSISGAVSGWRLSKQFAE